MKLLFVVDDVRGGAGNVVMILANAFSDAGNEVGIIFGNLHSTSDKLCSKVCVFKVDTAYRGKGKLRYLRAVCQKMRKAIDDFAPDIVLSFLDNLNTISCFSLWNSPVPIIVCERSNPLIVKPKRLWNLLRYIAYMRADAITVQCIPFKKMYHGIFESKTFVMPNPVKTSPVTYQMRAEASKLVTAARLNPVKGLDVLLKMFQQIHADYPNTQLTVWGEGNERQRLEAQIVELKLEDCVKLPGHTEDVPEKLNDGDIYLMTSIQEGFPNALCEAMASGLPCVAFECHTGFREIATDQLDVRLVQPGDFSGFIQATEELLESGERRVSLSRSAVHISARFSVEKIHAKWKSLIDQIMAQKKSE